jgi:hypothetical protein
LLYSKTDLGRRKTTNTLGLYHRSAAEIKQWDRVGFPPLGPSRNKLAAACISLIKLDAVVNGFIARANSSWPARRDCREEVMAADDGSLLKSVIQWNDFFAMNECRDLIFHVQEHHITLREIKLFGSAWHKVEVA